MNTAIIKAVPRDEFEEISIHMPEWKTKFLHLVKLGKRIRYYARNMPLIPQEIRAELERMSYVDLILEQDQVQHFLIPRAD